MNKERVVLILEDLNRKLDLLLEMQDALLKEVKGYREKSTPSLVADLSAHRADTEAHHGMYRVKEKPEGFGGDDGNNDSHG